MMEKPRPESGMMRLPESRESEGRRTLSLEAFDDGYFRSLEGDDGWIAIGQENCRNQRYFTVTSEEGERLGIVGMYDTEDEANISHTVVDPAHRGKGLAARFKERLLDELGEDHYVATVDLDNAPSLKAMERIPGIQVVSDEEYEKEYHKRKFRYEQPHEDGSE